MDHTTNDKERTMTGTSLKGLRNIRDVRPGLICKETAEETWGRKKRKTEARSMNSMHTHLRKSVQ